MRPDLRALILPALTLAAVAAAFAPVPALRPAAAPLVLVLPGWAVLDAALPRERGAGLERVASAVGLSLALAVLCGLALDRAGLLTPAGWSVSLGGFTLAVWAAGRVARLAAPYPGRVARPPWRMPSRGSWAAAALLVPALALAGAAIWTALQGALAHREYAFTEFWLVPSGPGSAVLGLRNLETVEAGYAVQIMAGTDVVGRWPPITLGPGETATRTVAVDALPGPPRRMEAWLYRSDRPDAVYRKVWLTTPPEEPATTARSPGAPSAHAADAMDDAAEPDGLAELKNPAPTGPAPSTRDPTIRQGAIECAFSCWRSSTRPSSAARSATSSP